MTCPRAAEVRLVALIEHGLTFFIVALLLIVLAPRGTAHVAEESLPHILFVDAASLVHGGGLALKLAVELLKAKQGPLLFY